MRDLRINLGFTYANTQYRNNLVGRDDGSPLNPALRDAAGPEHLQRAASGWNRGAGLDAAIGVGRLDAACSMSMRASSSKYNTGSDLFPQKGQAATLWSTAASASAGPTDCWSVELWAQNLFNQDYAQVAFNSPFQQGGSTTPPFAAGFTHAPFIDPHIRAGASSSRSSWPSRAPLA